MRIFSFHYKGRIIIMKQLFVWLLIASLSACAPLSKHDSIVGDAGEVIGRTLLCPVTLCMSEVAFSLQEEQRQYRAWYRQLSPEQQMLEDQRAHERGLAAMQAVSAMQSRRMSEPQPLYHQDAWQPYQARPSVQQPPRQPMNCTSQLIGNQAYTNCY
jgi:hypothetical protein